MTTPENLNDPQDAFDLEAGVPHVPATAPAIDGELRPKPKHADRISGRIIGIVVAFIVLMLVIFFVSLDAMDNKKKKKPESETAAKTADKGESVAAPKELMTDDGGEDGFGKQHNASLVKPEKAKEAILPGETNERMFNNPNDVRVPPISGYGNDSSRIPKDKNPAGLKNTAPTAQELAEEEARQAELKIKEQRQLRMDQARSDGLSAKPFSMDEGSKETANEGVLKTTVKNTNVVAIDPATVLPPSRTAAALAASGQQSEQDEKLNFVKDAAKDDRSYHQHKAVKPLSKNEIKTGSFIPLALAQGVNSDLPGQITARVTEGVYDTITGCRLLIPAMSTVVGKYDSKVALGQNRMLVVWNSIVFPDGEELNLAGMQGYDTAGYSGLNSEVDNHFWRLFGLTFGMSMLTTTVEMSVPQSNSTGAAQTPSQIMSTALAQQYGQLGAQILGKYMAVQPTLTNKPGERFLIMVPHTVVLDKVWRNRCETGSSADE